MRHAAVVILLWASPLFAAQRTFVASNGLDTNPCTHDQPCRSFNAAIAATTTAGEVVALDSAGYGSATIATAITIVGAPGVHAGVSVFSGNGIEVNAGSGDNVVLRNLSITGLGGSRGVNVNGVGALHVENCIVAGFTDFGIFANVTGAAIFIDGCAIRDVTSVGTYVVQPAHTFVTNTRFENSGSGVSLIGGTLTVHRCDFSHDDSAGINAGISTASPTIDVLGSTFTSCGNGLVIGGTLGVLTIRDSIVSSNSFGIRVQALAQGASAEAHIQNCTVSGNSEGIYVGGFTGTTNIATVSNSLVVNNIQAIDIQSAGANLVRLTGNTITRNSVGVGNPPGTALSAGDNVISGNGLDTSQPLTALTKQ